MFTSERVVGTTTYGHEKDGANMTRSSV